MFIIKEYGSLNRALSILVSGGVILCPAFTLYGISAGLFDIYANKRIYKIKRRDYGKPFIVIALKEFILESAVDVDKDKLSYLLDHAITVVVKTPLDLPFYAKSEGRVAFRAANTPFLKYVCSKTPITSTSMNISGVDMKLSRFGDMVKRFKRLVDGFVFGKVLGEQSTIVKLDGDKVEFLRKGYNSEKVMEVL